MSKCTRKPLTAQAVQEAMEQHDGLVHAFIRRQGGGDIPYEEALQAGRIGLWRAIQGYDPARGTAFSTYAWVAICHQIHRRAKELSQDIDGWSQEVPASLLRFPKRRGSRQETMDRIGGLFPPPVHCHFLRNALTYTTDLTAESPRTQRVSYIY